MKALRLHLIMACARPWNIPILAPKYLEKVKPHPFELRWYIFQQGPEPDRKGNLKLNEGIDMIPNNGWFMILSDDTYQHPELFFRIGEMLEERPDAGAIVFSQYRGGGNFLRAHPNNMSPCNVCGGQVIFNREFVGDKRLKWEEHGGCSDGVLIQELFKEHPERFVFRDEVLCYFGSLEWPENAR